MKHLKKLIAAALTMFVAFAVSTVALAAQQSTITINNAAKGETYAVYKVLDATIAGGNKIAYTGTIPTQFADVLDATPIEDGENTYSAITAKADATEDDLKAAAKAYVLSVEVAENNQYATDYEALTKGKTFLAATTSQVADGSGQVEFTLDAGYYIVVSTQGTNVIVDSATNPAATINEKNTTKITADKKVGNTSYSIGDTITYTATFDTANYVDDNIVIEYKIQDTLPAFLSDATVTSVTIGGVNYPAPAEGAEYVAPQFSNNTITIPWANSTSDGYESIYTNGAQIVVTYTAKLTDKANTNTANTNTVSIHPTTWDGTTTEEPWSDSWSADAVVKTYGAAIQKVDENNQPLAGATFKFQGLTVTGSNGVYTVVSYDKSANAAMSEALATDAEGKLYIIGLAEDVTLTAKEAVAPEGYNLLTSDVSVPAQKLTEVLYKEAGTKYYDAKGNLVSESVTGGTTEVVEDNNLEMLDAAAVEIVNNQGTELPSTGGIGTTIFYIVGGIMVVAAGVLLVTKKRVANN